MCVLSHVGGIFVSLYGSEQILMGEEQFSNMFVGLSRI